MSAFQAECRQFEPDHPLQYIMKKILPLLLLPALALAESGYGEYRISKSMNSEQACIMATQLAIQDALKNINGETISITETYQCTENKKSANCNLTKDAESRITGAVKNVRNKIVKVENDVCKVMLEVTAKQANFLDVDIETLAKYKHLDNVEIPVRSSEPVYVYVFNNNVNDLKLVYPNRSQKHVKIDSKGVISLIALLPTGLNTSDENLTFIFSRYPIDFVRREYTSVQLNEIVEAIPFESKRIFKRNILITLRVP